jgi:hypothetical protein
MAQLRPIGKNEKEKGIDSFGHYYMYTDKKNIPSVIIIDFSS